MSRIYLVHTHLLAVKRRLFVIEAGRTAVLGRTLQAMLHHICCQATCYLLLAYHISTWKAICMHVLCTTHWTPLGAPAEGVRVLFVHPGNRLQCFTALS